MVKHIGISFVEKRQKNEQLASNDLRIFKSVKKTEIDRKHITLLLKETNL